MDTWKLAYIRVKQAEKIALESQHIQQALMARKIVRHKNNHRFLAKIQAIKDLILRYGEILYCRTLGLIYSKTE